MAARDQNNAHIKIEPTDDKPLIMSYPPGDPFNPPPVYSYGYEANNYGDETNRTVYYNHNMPMYNFGYNATLAPEIFRNTSTFQSMPFQSHPVQNGWPAPSVESGSFYGAAVPIYNTFSYNSGAAGVESSLDPQAVHLSPIETAALFPEIDMTDLETTSDFSSASGSFYYPTESASPFDAASPAPSNIYQGDASTVQALGVLSAVQQPITVNWQPGTAPQSSPFSDSEESQTPASTAETASNYGSPVTMHITDEDLRNLSGRRRARAQQESQPRARRGSAGREARIELMVKLRKKGMAYGTMIKKYPEIFIQPENTMRGQMRVVEKPKEARPRCPTWQEEDIELLRQGVARHYEENAYNTTKKLPPWKKVTEWMSENGASHDFSATAASRMWKKISEAE